MNSFKTDKLLLSRGAGVGKSTVTNTLYEAPRRYMNSQLENDPDDISVIKVAQIIQLILLIYLVLT